MSAENWFDKTAQELESKLVGSIIFCPKRALLLTKVESVNLKTDSLPGTLATTSFSKDNLIAYVSSGDKGAVMLTAGVTTAEEKAVGRGKTARFVPLDTPEEVAKVLGVEEGKKYILGETEFGRVFVITDSPL